MFANFTRNQQLNYQKNLKKKGKIVKNQKKMMTLIKTKIKIKKKKNKRKIKSLNNLQKNLKNKR